MGWNQSDYGFMRHAHIDVTMEVYNHIGELTRIENEIARLDNMVLNA